MNNPFRYTPSDSLIKAANNLISTIGSDSTLHGLFKEGKMMGVLEVEDIEGKHSFLYAFSGNVKGRNIIEGFVPPIYDLLNPDGYFKKEEAEISAISKTADEISRSYRFNKAVLELEATKEKFSIEIDRMRQAMEESKNRREKDRASLDSLSQEDREAKELELIRISQFEKAELRRLKKRAESDIANARERVQEYNAEISRLKDEMKRRSEALQEWIFRQFVVHNAKGEEKSILEIFKEKGIIPPGGTGECCAPKLLEFAYRNNLRPVQIGEFWYGAPISMHIQGHFYQACQAKCANLLDFMLEGLDIKKENSTSPRWSVIHEDDSIIVVNKPSGILSTPGKTGDASLIEIVSEQKNIQLYSVHRLDMDTSGLIIFAKTVDAQKHLQRQFENGCVKKVYKARLDYINDNLKSDYFNGTVTGRINLPIAEDYENRPLQKVDYRDGKESITDYQIETIRPDGSVDVLFYPQTGRTHQLRIHSAHPNGLGGPISGDRLYGSTTDIVLQLKAIEISLFHPKTGLKEKYSIE